MLSTQAEAYVADVAKRVGRVDISFDAIGMDDVQGTPLIGMAVDDFTRPISNAARTQFVTTKAVAPYMVDQGSGVIMMLTASPSRIGWSRVGGVGPACAALEGLSRQLAAELGPSGVRVVCLRSAGSPESIPGTMEVHAAGRKMGRGEFIGYLEETTQLKRLLSGTRSSWIPCSNQAVAVR
jgi:NAD(P)-dependent dehydrogenase (short-subunit alcohol dehydrogenase family)